jgi:hypothetical protein
MTRRTRLVVALVAVVLVVVAALFAWRRLWQTAEQHFTSDTCTVNGYDIDPDQAAVASTMVGAVTRYPTSLPPRAIVLVLAAALQESKLTNIPPGEGDRDSVGVLQQRPSQGWGKVAGQPDSIAARTKRLTDVGEATKEFLDHLVQVPHWQTLPLADAVQAVQISADGSAYAQHEEEAQSLSDALRGARPAGITCDFDKPTVVAAPAVVAAQARAQLGIDTPVSSGTQVLVPGAHWQTAAWFVANADRLGIDQVDYSGHRWQRGNGWHTTPTRPSMVIATMAKK